MPHEKDASLLVRRASPADRLPLYRMLELYQHDLSDIWDQDLDLHGEFGYALDRYWQKPACAPYVFTVSGASIAACTGGRFTEQVLSSGWWQGVVQCFEISAGGDPAATMAPSESPAQPAR